MIYTNNAHALDVKFYAGVTRVGYAHIAVD